ncbi:hypothetical protein [Arthrobacter sp. NPDC092385]|uniref:hypothetical protein n=1 Tax=Arthrobacter sp. NPDC092385 TaxID=3363943 RepID=UPI00380C7573
MTDTDLVVAFPTRLERARLLAVVTRFVAVLTWLGALAVVGVTGSGTLLVLLLLPLALTAAAVWAARAQPAHDPGTGSRPDALVVVPLAYAAVLAWIGIVSFALVTIASVILLAIPLVATGAAWAAHRRMKALPPSTS